MDDSNIDSLTALGHSGRMAVFRLLARRAPDEIPAGELAQTLGLKASTLSVYVAALARAGLIRATRDGRSIRYTIDLDRVGGLVEFLVNDCCRGRPELILPLVADAENAALRPLDDTAGVRNVLFVCTGNSARSIFAEAILRRAGGDRFRAFSAGTAPRPELNDFALDVLRKEGCETGPLRPKSIDEFRGGNAPEMDFVFTVCNQAANEDCLPLPGRPVSAHWGMVDPAKVTGSAAEKTTAFQSTYELLQRRLQAFLSLPVEKLDRLELHRELDEIARRTPA